MHDIPTLGHDDAERAIAAIRAAVTELAEQFPVPAARLGQPEAVAG